MDLLEAKEREVKECQDKYDKAMTFKQVSVRWIANEDDDSRSVCQAVLDDAMKCKAKMDAATALLNGLSGERIRWTEQSGQFKSETERLVGDVLILTGFLGYTGPFNQEFRNTLQENWVQELTEKKIPFTLNLSVTESLTDTATVSCPAADERRLYTKKKKKLCRPENGTCKVFPLTSCRSRTVSS